MTLVSLTIWAFIPLVPRPVTAPATIPDKIPMMAITANSSTKVKPRVPRFKKRGNPIRICPAPALRRKLTRMSVVLLPHGRLKL